MAIYISSIIGDGKTIETAYRPIGFEQSGASWIDLRPDSSKPDGFGIVYLPTPVIDARLTKIADEKYEVLTSGIKNIISNRFSVLLSNTKINELIFELLTLGKDDGTRWGALKPTKGNWEVWLGEKIFSMPVISGGANLFADTFDRADSDSLGASWTERRGDWDILSNKAVHAALGTDPDVCHTAAYGTADYTVQAIIRSPSSTGWYGIGGRRANYSTTDSDVYFVILSIGSADPQLYKRVSGTNTQLGSNGSLTTSQNVDYTVKLSMQGSTIKGIVNTIEYQSVTDTAISAAGDAAIMQLANSIVGLWNDFTVDDFGGGGDPEGSLIGGKLIRGGLLKHGVLVGRG